MDLVCHFVMIGEESTGMEKFIERIKQVYPSLSIENCRFNEMGQNKSVSKWNRNC